MQVIPSFDPSASISGYINVSSADPGSKILLYNLSLVTIKLNFENGDTSLLHAGEANYWMLDGTTPQLEWTQYSILNSGAPPISMITGTVYRADENINGTYPVLIAYQVGIGNTTPLSTATTSIANDGNTPLTTFIESTPSDAASSTWKADNSGNLTIKGDNAGTLTTLLQLVAGATPAVKIAAASIVAEVLGGLLVDGTLTSTGAATMSSTLAVTGNETVGGTLGVTGAATMSSTLGVTGAATLSSTLGVTGAATIGGNLTLSNGIVKASNTRLDFSGSDSFMYAGTSSNTIHFQVAVGTDILTVGSGGVGAPNGVNFNIGRIKDFNSGSALSGTINHGISGTPSSVQVTCNTSNSSATVGASNYTSTQFTLTVGSALNGSWVAYR